MTKNEIKDKRLHKVLKYILEEHLKSTVLPTKFTWKIEEVRRDLKLSANELNYLCRILGRDDIVYFNTSTIEFSSDSGFHNATEAYQSKRYLPTSNFWEVPINIALLVGGFATLGLLVLGFYSNQQTDTINRLQNENQNLLIKIDSLFKINTKPVIDSTKID